VLAVDAADAVAAAAEADPDRQPGAEGDLDRGDRLLAQQRHRLEQEQVGRILLESPREQAQRLQALLALDVAVDAERHRARSRPALGLDRLARNAQPKPRDVHPVRQAAGRCAAGLDLGGGEDRPRVRRDDVAPGGDVRAVDVEHRVGSVVERARAPEAAVAVPQLAGLRALELGRVAAVEDHGIAAREQLPDQFAPVHTSQHNCNICCCTCNP
jgi:hypothetical protein